MDAPSTPSPVALRGSELGRALGMPDAEVAPPASRDPWLALERAEIAAAELREDRDAESDGPPSLRGAELEAFLEALREPPSGVRSRH